MLNLNDFLIFIGLDPAIIGDYFGVCIHALSKQKPKDKVWMPFLLKLTKMQKGDYKSTWEQLTKGTLSKYSNFKAINIDYTNEKTLADFLEDKYGKYRVKKTPFTKGESGTKMQMAQSSKKLLDNGYAFPDHNKITNPIDRDNIRTLKQQIINEQILLNTDGSIKFEHKGKHNDLLHAWMLSLDITVEYMTSKLGRSVTHIGGSVYGNKKLSRSEWEHQQDVDMAFGNY